MRVDVVEGKGRLVAKGPWHCHVHPPFFSRLLPHCPFSWPWTQAHPSSSLCPQHPSCPDVNTGTSSFKSCGTVRCQCHQCHWLAHSDLENEWSVCFCWWLIEWTSLPQEEISFLFWLRRNGQSRKWNRRIPASPTSLPGLPTMNSLGLESSLTSSDIYSPHSSEFVLPSEIGHPYM